MPGTWIIVWRSVAAGFEEQYGDVRVFGQAGRDDGARGAGAYDDVVEFAHLRFLLGGVEGEIYSVY